jgi:hypothetical protein
LFLSGGIFTTTNSGVTWISNAAPNLPWVSVASSADGSKLVVVASGGSIYSSTNFGQDWVSNNAPNKSWVTVVSSADGSKRFASVDSGQGNFSSTIALPSPSINIAPAGGNLMLSWFVPSTNFVLLQSYDLSGWSDMTNTPVLNFSNLQNQVVLPSSADNVFYRLKTP